MQELKHRIMSEVRDEVTVFAECTLEEMSAHFFLYPTTLRLTSAGYKHLRQVFTAYPFDIDKQLLRPKHLIALADAMEYPYYITHSSLVVFSDSDAMIIKLCGTVEKFLETYVVSH